MKTLVIPDIHQKTHLVDAILASEVKYDEVVFLGDWFDSFQEPPLVNSFKNTCKYLKSLLLDHPQREKFVFLTGNHDVSYIYCNNGPSKSPFPHPDAYFCSGFTEAKAKIFRSEFYDQNLKDEFFLTNFKLAHQSQGFTLSHAGIHPSYLPLTENIETLVSKVLPNVWENFRNLDHPRNKVLSGAGYARYGNVPVGGLIWLDWRQEFLPAARIGSQIVGHTHVQEPTSIALNSPLESWNIDTEKDYGIILNNRFSTKLIKQPKYNNYTP